MRLYLNDHQYIAMTLNIEITAPITPHTIILKVSKSIDTCLIKMYRSNNTINKL